MNLGPYFVPSVDKLIRAEVNGKINFQAEAFGSSSVQANFQLWAVQWVPHGTSAADVVTTSDGPNWLIRQQVGSQESRVTWSPNTDTSAVLSGYPLVASWAGQLPIGADIDLWLSARAPTGVTIANQNLFASLRFWWS